MNARTIAILSALVLLCGAGAVALFRDGQDGHADPRRSDGGARSPETRRSVQDAVIEPWRGRLLDLASAAAAAMPLDPHVKTRSRLQSDIVAACLHLDQPLRARAVAAEIANWRGGVACADLGRWLGERGFQDEAWLCLGNAAAAAERNDRDATGQEWRSERIRSAIASARGAMRRTSGNGAETEPDPAALETQIRNLDAVLERGALEDARSALEACVEILGRHHARDEIRRQTLERVRKGHAKLPAGIRVEMLVGAARTLLDHGDPGTARELLAEARALVDGRAWLPEDLIPRLAEMAALKSRLGDGGDARRELALARATYDTERSRIADIYRAGVLRALAEASLALGDGAEALASWRQAVEEGVANPNSRPRADDLVATCLSMALAGAEPDAALLARMTSIRAGLGDPW